MRLPVMPPVKPMLTKAVTFEDAVQPDSQGRLPPCEPKWDGIRRSS